MHGRCVRRANHIFAKEKRTIFSTLRRPCYFLSWLQTETAVCCGQNGVEARLAQRFGTPFSPPFLNGGVVCGRCRFPPNYAPCVRSVPDFGGKEFGNTQSLPQQQPLAIMNLNPPPAKVRAFAPPARPASERAPFFRLVCLFFLCRLTVFLTFNFCCRLCFRWYICRIGGAEDGDSPPPPPSPPLRASRLGVQPPQQQGPALGGSNGKAKGVAGGRAETSRQRRERLKRERAQKKQQASGGGGGAGKDIEKPRYGMVADGAPRCLVMPRGGGEVINMVWGYGGALKLVLGEGLVSISGSACCGNLPLMFLIGPVADRGRGSLPFLPWNFRRTYL